MYIEKLWKNVCCILLPLFDVDTYLNKQKNLYIFDIILKKKTKRI